MNNDYKLWLGGSDLLSDSATVWTVVLRPVSDEGFQIVDLEERQKDGIIDMAYYKKLLSDEVGQADESIYNPSAKGFYTLEYIGQAISSDKHALWKQRVHGIGTAFPYIWCGAIWMALDIIDGDSLSLSESHLLQRVLTDDMRLNLLAEADYGNWHKHRDLSFLTADFLGLPEQDPKRIYGTSGCEFYIHPAGMSHDGRFSAMKYLDVGQPVVFEAEPNNTHDPNAVHIYTDYGSDIAYVPRQIASAIAFHMRRGASYTGIIAAILPGEQKPDDAIAIKMTAK
ncbi:MAG: hypothetical protein PWP48_736 [Clostridiales bacterium]|jgi:hypothetical protein|nr:hypothetical protein [Clostridiales bacterium]